MKQRITVEQLKELSPEQQERLRKWWEPKIFDVVLIDGKDELPVYQDSCEPDEEIYEKGQWSIDDVWFNTRDDPFTVPKAKCLPLLSIGRCIELLDYLKQCLVIRKKRGIWNCEETWGNSKVELIDALWRAVKEVL